MRQYHAASFIRHAQPPALAAEYTYSTVLRARPEAIGGICRGQASAFACAIRPRFSALGSGRSGAGWKAIVPCRPLSPRCVSGNLLVLFNPWYRTEPRSLVDKAIPAGYSAALPGHVVNYSGCTRYIPRLSP